VIREPVALSPDGPRPVPGVVRGFKKDGLPAVCGKTKNGS